jgi:hypothetical protein
LPLDTRNQSPNKQKGLRTFSLVFLINEINDPYTIGGD